jgi:hypothetical protein
MGAEPPHQSRLIMLYEVRSATKYAYYASVTALTVLRFVFGNSVVHVVHNNQGLHQACFFLTVSEGARSPQIFHPPDGQSDADAEAMEVRSISKPWQLPKPQTP